MKYLQMIDLWLLVDDNDGDDDGGDDDDDAELQKFRGNIKRQKGWKVKIERGVENVVVGVDASIVTYISVIAAENVVVDY